MQNAATVTLGIYKINYSTANWYEHLQLQLDELSHRAIRFTFYQRELFIVAPPENDLITRDSDSQNRATLASSVFLHCTHSASASL